jgi:hypothetical protein
MGTTFPCFLCGFAGPHHVVELTLNPDLPQDRQRAHPPLIRCGHCQQQIWEPDSGDGVAEPNLTFIRPELRDLAHAALEDRNLSRFLILAEGHHRGLLVEDNTLYFHRRSMWEDVHLAQLRLVQPD